MNLPLIKTAKQKKVAKLNALQDSDSHSQSEEEFDGIIDNDQSPTFGRKISKCTKINLNSKVIAIVVAVAILVVSLGGLIFVVKYSFGTCRHVSEQNYLKVLEMTTLKYTTKDGSTSETAIVAGGCFWSIQLSYDRIPAVISTSVGYIGGTKDNPTYGEVTTGTTGYVESVKIVFDPRIASYEDLIRVFFERHDPTTINQQGNDRGPQYRSAIFYFSDEQRIIAEKLKLETQQRLGKQVVTEISPATTFWDAESYHQKYLVNHGYSDTKGDPSDVPCYAN